MERVIGFEPTTSCLASTGYGLQQVAAATDKPRKPAYFLSFRCNGYRTGSRVYLTVRLQCAYNYLCLRARHASLTDPKNTVH
jgi:hypothetical protein